MSSSSFTRVGVTHTSTTQEGEGRCHGHLLPFFPLEVRWSDNDRRPHLLQKRFPSKKKGVEGIFPPFLSQGKVEWLVLPQFHKDNGEVDLPSSEGKGGSHARPPSCLWKCDGVTIITRSSTSLKHIRPPRREGSGSMVSPPLFPSGNEMAAPHAPPLLKERDPFKEE